MIRWEKAPYQRDAWFADTPVGRYLIRRPYRGAREFRVFLNNYRSKYHGSLEQCQKTVEQIIAGLALADGKDVR